MKITGSQWQPMIFPLISKGCAPYSYLEYLSIQNMKVLSWALKGVLYSMMMGSDLLGLTVAV